MRSKKLIVVSHCVLNQNSVLNDWERAKGAFPISKKIIDSGVGIIQLPCPELRFNGLNRKPLSYEDYDNLEYRQMCQQMVTPIVGDLKHYIENGYLFVGLIGINNSPTCSISNTRGVLMEEFFKLCNIENIKINSFEIPEEYTETNTIEIENLMQILEG